MVGRKESEPVSVYQLKVTLEDIEPPIWRRILVKGDVTLFKLHRIIQLAMGWEDYHLHEFMVGEECYAIPSPEDPWPMEMKNEKRAKLSKVAPAERSSFVYEYDLGDSWRHDILVEKIFQPKKDGKQSILIRLLTLKMWISAKTAIAAANKSWMPCQAL